MQGIQDIFQIWSSVEDMADEIGRKSNTVAKWRRRGRIPEEAWAPIIEAAATHKRRLTVKDFMRLNKPMGPRGAASPLHPNYRAEA